MPFIKLSTAHKMESGIFTVKDCFELVSYIATLIGVGALIFGVYSYKLTQKQLNFSVIERCISNFNKDFSSISQDSDEAFLRKYIDFVNEELFYFEKDYIPRDVAYEWIDGMIDYMPIYSDAKKEFINPDKALKKINELNLLINYQRVRKAFTVKDEYKPELLYGDSVNIAYSVRRKERDDLVKEIYGNLK